MFDHLSDCLQTLFQHFIIDTLSSGFQHKENKRFVKQDERYKLSKAYRLKTENQNKDSIGSDVFQQLQKLCNLYME